MKRWLVTGGLGFIGSAFIRMIVAECDDVSIVNLDAETYAANHANVASIAQTDRYRFVRGSICDPTVVDPLVRSGVDAIVNFAAETHVDRSIDAPSTFLTTDVLGTHVLLEAARRYGVGRFLQVSTDEVYGDVASGSSDERAPVAPRSPYAASKAGADLQALAYATTYDVPVLVTRGSNTYGPYQYPEKLVPLFITNLIDDREVPLYGDGLQTREWIHVEDHARGIAHVLRHGTIGEVYNIGTGTPQTNLELTKRLVELCGRDVTTHVRHVLDRAGHDRRYAIDSTKATRLGWRPTKPFDRGIADVVGWYRENEAWWRPTRGPAFQAYYRRQYVERENA